MLKFFLLILGFSFSFANVHAEEIFGRVVIQGEHGTYGRKIVQLMTEESAPPHYKQVLILNGLTPPDLAANPKPQFAALTSNGITFYEHDYIRIKGTRRPNGNFNGYIIDNVEVIEVVASNPRLECHSLVDASGAYYYVQFGTSYTDVYADQLLGFVRLNECDTKDGLKNCSYIFGSGEFLSKNIQVSEHSPVDIRTEGNKGSLIIGNNGETEYRKKYGKEEYFDALLSGKYSTEFSMHFTSEMDLSKIAFDQAYGGLDIEDAAIKNTARKVKPNVRLHWKSTLRTLWIEDTIPLYCYRWK